MPISKPKSGESQKDFISRCMSEMVTEITDDKQRAAVCYKQWRTEKQYQIKRHAEKALESLKSEIERMDAIEKYRSEIDEVMKARTVGGFESPEPGDLPEAGAALLARVYAKCRKDGGDKEKCSRIAWTAVNNAGYKADINKRLQKAYATLSRIFKQAPPVDEDVILKDNYFDTLNCPAFLMEVPFNLSNVNPNNVFMKIPEAQEPVDHQRAFSQWMELYKMLISSGAMVYVLPSSSGLQDQVYVANLGLRLPQTLKKNSVIISNYESQPRVGEDVIGKKFFELMEFAVYQPETTWEGEADLKYIRENIYIGGYGIRTDIKSFQWMEEKFGMKIVPVKMTDERLYHFDCILFPIDNENALVCTEAVSPEDLKKIESVVNVIPVPIEHCAEGSTNNVRSGGMIFNTSNVASMSENDEGYELERARVKFLTDTLAKFGKTAVFVNLSEFDKSGASLSCMVMHLNYFDYVRPKIEAD